MLFIRIIVALYGPVGKGIGAYDKG
jgi:hypothetical protein